MLHLYTVLIVFPLLYQLFLFSPTTSPRIGLTRASPAAIGEIL